MSAETPDMWVVELYSQHMDKSIQFKVNGPVVVGRQVQGEDNQPDIDLSQFDAEAFGVSRRHLKLEVQNERLMVTDLSSGNGTLLKGNRLTPETAYAIQSNDSLQFGRLILTLNVLVSPNHGSIVRKQNTVQLSSEISSGNGQLVLILEDHHEVALALSMIVERAGYRHVICGDVASAIRVFNRRKPSAIIMDLMLPDMNGLEFCSYVRRDVQHNAVPVIVVSAAKTADRVAQAINAGADVFLGKPVSLQELQQVLGSLISQYERGVPLLQTRHLIGTAPLQSVEPESRQNAIVLFVAGHNAEPITLKIREPISFGRSIPNSRPGQHVDLSRYNAVENGVSREHMRLLFRHGHFYVEDNDSVNGTYVNGVPLDPHKLTQLNNADEIRLGQLRLYAYFLMDKEHEMLEE
jgi:DNA-binding response OmpR family regulator/pSer/pThr/pTyr-binding forkhead associated (FHA) protein